jgi:NAD-dependent histone deacetylase SIR2
MLPEDQTVDVAPIDEEEHEYSVRLRNPKPGQNIRPEAKTELKLETATKVELEIAYNPAPNKETKEEKVEA